MSKNKKGLKVPKNLVVVEVDRGLVENIYTDIQGLDVYVLDRDLAIVSEDVTEYNEALKQIVKKLNKVTV
jgi:hypothetical protein